MFDTIETVTLATAILLGTLLAGFYFGGLWWTVRQMPSTRHPLTLYSGSVILRLATALAVFFGILSYFGSTQLVASLVGFFAVRIFLVRHLAITSSAEPPAQKAT